MTTPGLAALIAQAHREAWRRQRLAEAVLALAAETSSIPSRDAEDPGLTSADVPLP